ncbi:hypothetical protein [Marinobacterium aestuariivivens]|uniref:Uncharacterized protein n=1 Tax=Marinobacterium aestuariivivens TaxID=1698799 RepID=A0ABW2A791_9GAMM
MRRLRCRYGRLWRRLRRSGPAREQQPKPLPPAEVKTPQEDRLWHQAS